MREADIREAEFMHKIPDFLRKVLPDSTSQKGKITLHHFPKIEALIYERKRRNGHRDQL